MSQKIGIEVVVNSNIKNETQDANKFNEALKRAAQTAKTIGVGAAAGGTSGSQRAAQMSQPVMATQVTEYGRARGSAGATGASARDFANQSQGLGGLVRLYATYAANVFAVGAAFRALSSAMDTANMVRGLDQIGAASGVALGGLSRQLVAATGGAISLREAMSATVKVTAAGLGSENVLRLGTVAAKASQALGVDLGDAVNRLSRGITKLEPELLDELGIFTKIEPAVQKYALALGKNASSLTDFERRQAFANAVLEEGEKKFAAIKVDANPYNKLAASLQNIAQSGLELINKVLAPIVNFLSESPTALIAALGGLGLALVRQIAPAFGQFRENIRKSNIEAAQAGKARVQSAIALQQELNAQVLRYSEIGADKEIAKLEAAEKRLNRLQAKLSTETAASKILAEKPDTADITKADIKAIRAAAAADEAAGNIALAKSQREIATAIVKVQNAEKGLSEEQRQKAANLQKELTNSRTIIGINAQLASSIQKASYKDQIVSNAAYAGSLIGPTRAIRLMLAELKAGEVQLNAFSRATVVARGTLAAFAGAAATIGAAINTALGVIGLIAGALSLLSTAFSATTRESKATGEALDVLEQSTKNLNNTIDVINSKPFLEQFSTQSVTARSNALDSLSTSIQKVIDTSQAELSRMNWIDSLKDNISKIWGGDVLSKSAEEISRGLAAAFSDATTANSTAGKAARESLERLLGTGVDLTDFEKIDAALAKLSKADRITAIKSIGFEINNLSKAAKAPAVALQGLDESLKKISESRQKFISGLLPTDPLSEFGRGLIATSFQFEEALKNPTVQLETIKKLFEQIKSLPVSPDLLLGLQDADAIAKNLQELQGELGSTQAKITQLTKARNEELSKSGKGFQTVKTGDIEKIEEYANKVQNSSSKVKELNTELGRLKGLGASLEIEIQTETESLSKFKDTINAAVVKTFEVGAEVVSARLGAEFVKASATVTQTFGSLLGNTKTGIAMRAEAERRMLAAQLAQIDATERNIRAQQDAVIVTKEANVLRLKALAAEKTRQGTLSEAEDQNISREVLRNEAEIVGLKKILSGTINVKQAFNLRAAEMRAAQRDPAAISTITEGGLQLAQQLEASRASRANIGAQVFGVNITERINQFKLEEENNIKRKQADLDALKASAALLASNREINSETNEAALIARQSAEAAVQLAEQELRVLQAKREISVQEKLQQELLALKTDEGRTRAKQVGEDIDNLKELVNLTERAFATKEQETQQKNILDLVDVRLRNRLKILDQEGQKAKDLDAAREFALRTEEQSFDFLQRSVELSATYIARRKEALDVKRAEFDFDKQIREAEEARNRALLESETRTKKIELAAPPTAATAAEVSGDIEIGAARSEALAIEIAARDVINQQYERQATAATRSLELTKAQAAETRRVAEEQEKYNKLLQNAADLGSTLGNVFRGLGSSADRFADGIEKFVTGLTEGAIQTEKNAKATAAIQERITLTAEGSQERKEAEQELGVQQKKNAKDELSNNIKLVGSAKMLFKEKSTGYKLLAGIERAMHIVKLAMAAKEMAVDIANTVKSVANSGVRTAASVVEAGVAGVTAVVKSIASLPFPFNIAAGAVVAGIVASLLSKIGGDPPTSFSAGGSAVSAEKRQEVQGSAMNYNDQGQLVRVREGVFGDTEAKSESIANSLEIIRDNSVAGLAYDDKLLKAFEKLSRSLETAAKRLYGITGVTGGSAFGTVEGSTGTSILGLSLSKTTTSIIDSGLKITGSFLELARATGGVIEGFETVQTTRKRFIGKTKTSIDTREFGLDDATVQAINDAFGSALDALYSVGDTLKTDQQKIDQALASLQVNEFASLRGLKGKDLQEALNAVIGSVVDDAAVAAFTQLKLFRKFGEGMLETVVRVADTNRKIEQVLGNLTNRPALDIELDITEALAEASGGLSNFLENIESFTDNFLTEEEKLGPTRRAVETELNRLGLSSIKTRQQFKQVVQTLINTGQAGTETFLSLIKLSDGFAKVTESAEKTNDALKSAYDARVSELKGARSEFENFAKSLREYQLSLKTGSLSPLTPLEQYRELRAEFLTTRELAQRGDVGAIGKLQSISNSFLQASQKMYASSDEYIGDFQLVSQTIDQTATFAELQIDIANNTLAEIKNVVGALVELKTETEKVPVALTGLGTSLTTALTAAQAANGSATISDIPVIGGEVADIVSGYEFQRQADAAEAAAEAAKAAAEAAAAAARAAQSMFGQLYNTVMGYDYGIGAAMGAAFDTGGVRKFARGGIVNGLTPFSYSSGLGVMGEAGPEAIMPLRRTPSGNLGVISMAGNGDMLRELARLNQQVETLTRAVSEGAVINAQATDRNTEAVVGAVVDKTVNNTYQTRLKDKVQVV
jgi:hypothetical protein